MSNFKRARVPSQQQLERWGNMLKNMKHMESLESSLEMLGSPSISEWDNFLNVIETLDAMVINLSEHLEVEEVNDRVGLLNISTNQKRKIDE